MTKLGTKRIHLVRARGGNVKHRALRLDSGNFAWASEGCTRKVRILDVVYNATSNELVRTKTLVKNAIVVVDATPFRFFYEQHYGIQLGKKKSEDSKDTLKISKKRQWLVDQHKKDSVMDPAVGEEFRSGRLLACISSRPGQCGRCDGYILEGPELGFYLKRLRRKGDAEVAAPAEAVVSEVKA